MSDKPEERHVYISEGISREAFTDVGVRATAGRTDLIYFIHEHKYNPFGDTPCNDRCTLIQSGIVGTNVQHITLLDDAEAPISG